MLAGFVRGQQRSEGGFWVGPDGGRRGRRRRRRSPGRRPHARRTARSRIRLYATDQSGVMEQKIVSQ
jgi:hypothetical protein